MISKELFCKTIADIQEQDRKISEFDHALGKICDSAIGANLKKNMCSTRAFFCHFRTQTKSNGDQAHF